MKKAIVTQSFTNVQWHGEEYPYYKEDAEENVFNVGDEVLVLHEAEPNPMGRLFVIFNERISEATVVNEKYIKFKD